ncbi:MAG: hypothetical protein U9O98_04965 [Asgard group archaeon]|nr:hypothetical protein [Asgard group archaeon]
MVGSHRFISFIAESYESGYHNNDIFLSTSTDIATWSTEPVFTTNTTVTLFTSLLASASGDVSIVSDEFYPVAENVTQYIYYGKYLIYFDTNNVNLSLLTCVIPLLVLPIVVKKKK